MTGHPSPATLEARLAHARQLVRWCRARRWAELEAAYQRLAKDLEGMLRQAIADQQRVGR